MSYINDIADAVWEYATRELDVKSPSASDGSYLDDIGYAVWTYETREVDSAGGETIYLEAEIFNDTATPNVSATSIRDLLSQITNDTNTPSIAENLSRVLTAAITNTTTTPSVGASAIRPLDAQITNGATTPTISATLLRHLVADIHNLTATFILLVSSRLSVESQVVFDIVFTSEKKDRMADMIELLKRDLINDEGFSSTCYRDIRGFWTIGYGRLVDPVRYGSGITKTEASILLDNDICSKMLELSERWPFYHKLDSARKRAVLNMAFQLGVSGFLNFKRTVKLLEEGRHPEAADEALISNWAKQTPARAKRVTDLIRYGENT